jgi:hypothetical protein
VIAHVAAQTIEDLERAIDLVLHYIVRSLCPFGEFVRPLQVHRQLVLNGSDAASRRSAESICRHLPVLHLETTKPGPAVDGVGENAYPLQFLGKLRDCEQLTLS